MKKIVILPIKEPWASKIINGDKKIEFRNWKPKWDLGQEVWVVATGKTKKPRKIIGSFKYGGYYNSLVNNDFSLEQIKKWGGDKTTTGLIVKSVEKFVYPLELKAFLKNTPQKYQYIEVEDKK